MIAASLFCLLTSALSAPFVQVGPRPSESPSLDLAFEGRRILRAQATDAPIGEIGRRLADALKVPVRVSPESARTRVSFRPLKNPSLEELLQQITRSPFIETEEGWGREPKLIGIVLGGELASAPGDPPSGGMLVEGHTDEELVGEDDDPAAPRPEKPRPSPSPTPAEPEGPFLRVSKDENGRISVRARDQGLGLILFKIAQAYQVRFDMRISEAPVVGEVSILAALPSDLPGILGAGVGLVVRRHVVTGEERALRFFLESPDPAY